MKITLLLFAAAALCAASTIFSLEVGGSCTGGCGPSPYGTVSLTQVDAQHVDVLASLESGNFFVQTGGPHRSFGFNILGDPAIALIGLSSGFSFTGASAPDAGYGTFSYAILGPPPSNHCCPSLNFSVGRVDNAALSVADFVANSQGYLFEADIFGGVTGNTGEVASVVPEPAMYLLIGTGLFALVWLKIRARRRE